MFPTLENVPALPGLSQNAAVSESMSLILKKKRTNNRIFFTV